MNSGNVLKGVFPMASGTDYLRDMNASKYVLCERIMDYYKRRGQHKNISLEVIKEGRVYVVRSNIKFNVGTI